MRRVRNCMAPLKNPGPSPASIHRYTSLYPKHIYDQTNVADQINLNISKSCHFHIRDIRRIRHLFPQPQLLRIHLSPSTAIHFTLASCKQISQSGISQTNLNELQRIQNSSHLHINPIITWKMTFSVIAHWSTTLEFTLS